MEEVEGGGGMGTGREEGDTAACWGDEGDGWGGWSEGCALRLRLDWLHDLAWPGSGLGGRGLGRIPPLKLWQWGSSSSWLWDRAVGPLLDWEAWDRLWGCG